MMNQSSFKPSPGRGCCTVLTVSKPASTTEKQSVLMPITSHLVSNSHLQGRRRSGVPPLLTVGQPCNFTSVLWSWCCVGRLKTATQDAEAASGKNSVLENWSKAPLSTAPCLLSMVEFKICFTDSCYREWNLTSLTQKKSVTLPTARLLCWKIEATVLQGKNSVLEHWSKAVLSTASCLLSLLEIDDSRYHKWNLTSSTWRKSVTD